MTDPMLTIVIVFDHASITGGAARVAFDSAVGLKRLGHRPIVFAAAGPVAPELLRADIETVCLDQKDLNSNPSQIAAATQGIWNLAAARKLGQLLKRLPAASTIIHVHGWAKALSPSIAVPIRRSGLPAVYTNHEYFQFCPNGGFYNYQRHHICTLKPLSTTCWATNCDSRSYARKIWRNARQTVVTKVAVLPQVFNHYIAISDFQERIIAPLLPADAALYRVDNPISMPDLGPKPSPANGGFLFVGRLSPEKGASVFAEAARLVGVTPTFVGDGHIADAMRQRYPEAHLVGWRDADGVRAAMRAARALVFPSLWYEGQPLTVLEAKSLGVPVIVSDACAGREEVRDGIDGLWFKSGDADDLARCLRRLGDDTVAEAMAEQAYASYRQRPRTLERHTSALLQIYDAMLKEAAAPSCDRKRGAANSPRHLSPSATS